MPFNTLNYIGGIIVATQLPILPKVLQRCLSPMIGAELSESNRLELQVEGRCLSPIVTVESLNSNGLASEMEENGEMTRSLSMASSSLDNRSAHCTNQQLSASMPPLSGRDIFGIDLEGNNTEDCSSREEASPITPYATRKHNATLQHLSPMDNTQTVSMPSYAASEKHNLLYLSSASLDDEDAIGLSYIDETKVLSDDDSTSKEADSSQMTTPVDGNRGQANRRRCSTDPTVREGHFSALLAVANIDKCDGKGSNGSTSSPHRKQRQLPLMWSPLKIGMRKMHSFDDVTSGSRPPSSHVNETNGNEPQQQQLLHGDSNVRSSTLALHAENEHGGVNGGVGTRTSPLPYRFPPSHYHVGLSIEHESAASEEEDGPSREWFWIWS